MNTLKVKSILLGLMATLMLSIIILSCTQQELPLPTEEAVVETSALNFEPTTTPLTQDNPIIITLKASEDIKNFNTEAGELLWDMATMTTYDNEETLPLIMIPIHNENESETISMFIAAYRATDNGFLSFINSFEMDTEADVTLGYTGEIVYKTVENIIAKRVSYVNGKVTEEQLNTALEDRFNVYCFLNCANAFGVPSSCFSAYNDCKNWRSVFNGACHRLAGCLLTNGGAIASCAYHCW